MPRFLLLLACVLVLVAAGCGGGDDDGSDDTVPASSFQENVVAGMMLADLVAEAGSEMTVTASEGPNSVDVALDDAYASYNAAPERKDEIIAGLVNDAKERLEAGIGDASLDQAGKDLMPLLQANFDVRGYGFEPAATEVPGDLSLVFVVDSDDSYTVVTPEDIERWGTTVEEVEERALDNLLEQTNEEAKLLCEPSGNQELCGWATSDGYDATRMVVPGLRRQIVREYGGPAVYAVPTNDVFVALPLEIVERGKTEELLRIKAQRDFQTSDNPVSPELFVDRNGQLDLLK